MWVGLLGSDMGTSSCSAVLLAVETIMIARASASWDGMSSMLLEVEFSMPKRLRRELASLNVISMHSWILASEGKAERVLMSTSFVLNYE